MTEPETNEQPSADAASDAKTASKPPPSGAPTSAGAPASGGAASGGAASGGAGPGAAAGSPEGEAPAVEFAEPEIAPDPLEIAKAEAAKYREQLLRTAADYDNFRKRSRREAEDAQRRGTEKALKELLPVFDNLERATSSAATAPDVKSVADGLAMVGRQFTNTLDKLGIKRIAAVGQPFDPALHEAIQHVDSEHPAGVIAVEVQAGYMLGDYLLRAALVAVSKGPAAPASDAASSNAGSDVTAEPANGPSGDPTPEA